MLNEMIDNNYIDIFAYAIGSQQHNLNWFIKGKKTIETIKTEAFNNLKNHTLKKDIEKMYQRYLTK